MTDVASDALVQLRQARGVLWDFDGVIKESVEVKTRAFRALFEEYGPEVVDRVERHHLEHGGVSRWKKIEYALEHFVGQPVTPGVVQRMGARFAELVVDAVVASPWVPGVEELLRSNPHDQRFAVITGTPEVEIVDILRRLGLSDLFAAVYGSPMSKKEAVPQALEALGIQATDAVMVGDSSTDWEAAVAHGVPFLWRRSVGSDAPPSGYTGTVVDNFEDTP